MRTIFYTHQTRGACAGVCACDRKHRMEKNCGKNPKRVPLLLPQQSVNDLNHMLNTNIKDAPNFIRISISSMKKSYLKITHELLRTKLRDSSPDFTFSIYYHQAIDLIESKIYKPLAPKSRKKPPHNVCSMFFESKGVEFINIVHILCEPEIVKSLLSSSVKFPMPMVTYKLTPPSFSISISLSTI